MRRLISLTTWGVAAALVACSRPPIPLSPTSPRPSAAIITRQDIDRAHVSSALDAVQRYRADALMARAPSSVYLERRTLPVVFLDGQYYGTVDELRNISADAIKEIRFYNSLDATRIFGVRYGGGVIQIVSRS